MSSGIYEILNTVNGKRYIGSARDLVSRWKAHRNGLLAGRHANRHLQSAWNKYGEQAFKFLPILTCAPTKQMLMFYEQQLIDKVQPEYNICPTAGTQLGMKRLPGFQVGRTQSKATREKIALGRVGMKNPAVSAANRVRVVSLETRAKMSKSRLGKPQSAEHAAKTAARMIGNTYTRGKTRSASAVEKTAAANRGMKRTPEQRENMSRGQRESYARRVAANVASQSHF